MTNEEACKLAERLWPHDGGQPRWQLEYRSTMYVTHHVWVDGNKVGAGDNWEEAFTAARPGWREEVRP